MNQTNLSLIHWGIAYIGIDNNEAMKHFSLVKERSPETYMELISSAAEELLDSLEVCKKKDRDSILQKCVQLMILTGVFKEV